jgi:CDP-glucose 4,6-dehydratase
VLEPLSGYLLLAQLLLERASDQPAAVAVSTLPSCAEAWNFGPALDSNRSVRELVEALYTVWPGQWLDASDPEAVHEAGLLHLVTDQSHHRLGWRPRWDLATTAERTARWYQRVHAGASPLQCCLEDLTAYWQAGGWPAPAP